MLRKRKKGQAIVELALVFPFFLLIIVGGIIDFGFAFYNFLTLQQLANDTAQWAADSRISSDSAISNFVNSKKPTWWNGTFTLYTVERLPLATTGGSLSTVIRIRLGYDSPTYTPFYQTMLNATTGNSSISLSAMASYKEPQHVRTRF